jgi:hypothetical protein
MVQMISEIINKARKFKSHDDKVSWLKQHNTLQLRNILIAMYDKDKIKFLIPSDPPPYNPSGAVENQGALYNECRKLKYLVDGFGGENVNKLKREQIFIQMLETVHKDDALLLLDMVAQKGYKDLSAKAINEAFGNIINEKSDVEKA